MGLGIATATSTHMHMSHPQFSQPCHSITFGLGILFWCLGSPDPCRIAKPTMAALCPTASSKNLCSPPPSSLLHRSSLLLSSSVPSRAKPFVPPCTRPFTFSFFYCISSRSTFCTPATEEGSGQHPPSARGAGASSLCLAGTDIFLSVSLVSLVSRFLFLTKPLIKKKKPN